MRAYARWLFLAALALSSACAVSDYRLITDNDQGNGGQGSGVVNTNGKAHLLGKGQVWFVWPDGNDQMVSFVDQRANGDRTLTTYNNFTTLDEYGGHSDVYCNPDWNGCAIFSAEDPESPDDDPFDGRLNPNCSGARTLSILVSTGRFYGECGRSQPLDLSDRLTLLNMGRLDTRAGREGLLYEVDAGSLSLFADNNAGTVHPLTVAGRGEVFVSWEPRPKVAIDLTHPLVKTALVDYAGFLSEEATGTTTLRIRYNGIGAELQLAGHRAPVSTPERVNALANTHF